MVSIIRQAVVTDKGLPGLKEVNIGDIKLNEESILSIDGSSTCSGVAILNSLSSVLYTCAFVRDEKKGKDYETPVRYKVRLKRAIEEILLNNPLIKQVYYEEPFFGFPEAAKILMMLRTSVEEIIEENAPNLDYIKLVEVSNKKWKKIFLAPEPCPVGTDLEKKAVRDKLLSLVPWLEGVTQDELDAIAMGYVALWQKAAHRDGDLASKKKVKPFKFNVKFIGAENDEDLLNELSFVMHDKKCGIPESLLETLEFYELPGKGDFYSYVYNCIGTEDVLVILSFSSKHYGNIILEHQLGNLAKNYARIYAVCWRKNRKS